MKIKSAKHWRDTRILSTEAAVATNPFTGKMKNNWWATFDSSLTEPLMPSRNHAARLHRELDRIVKRQSIAMDTAMDSEPSFAQKSSEIDEPSRQWLSSLRYYFSTLGPREALRVSHVRMLLSKIRSTI